MKPTKSTMRIRQADLDAAIFRPKNQIVNDDHEDVLTFCMFGKHNELANLKGEEDKNGYPLLYDAETKTGTIKEAKQRDEACAYCIYYSGRKKFYIKKNVQGRLLNPLGIYDEGQQMRKLNHKDQNVWLYKEVNVLAFEMYLKFLKTKNTAWLSNAERELL